MAILILIIAVLGFLYYKNLPTERVVIQKIEICGKNKVVIDGACVCDEKSGYYPIIGAFGGPDHNVCNACDADSVKVVTGARVCDPDGLGAERGVKKRPKAAPSPAEAEEQCGNGQVLNRDSKCEPAPAETSDDA